MAVRVYSPGTFALEAILNNPSNVATPTGLHFDGGYFWFVDAATLYQHKLVNNTFKEERPGIALTLPNAVANSIGSITGNGRDLFVAYRTGVGSGSQGAFAQIDQSGNVVRSFTGTISTAATAGSPTIECFGRYMWFSFTTSGGSPQNDTQLVDLAGGTQELTIMTTVNPNRFVVGLAYDGQKMITAVKNSSPSNLHYIHMNGDLSAGTSAGRLVTDMTFGSYDQKASFDGLQMYRGHSGITAQFSQNRLFALT